MAAAAGRKQKKKWSKGKVKDKAVHAVEIDKALEEKLNKEAQVARLLSIAILVDRTKINGSLARRWLREQHEKGVLRPVVAHHACRIYVRANKAATEEA